MTEKAPVMVRYARLTPKGKELFDEILTLLEDNIEIAAKGLDELVKDMKKK